jgi:hypothetical protein
MTICYISILQLRIFVKAKINLKSTPYFATMMLKLKRRVYNAFIPTSADRNTKNDKLSYTLPGYHNHCFRNENDAKDSIVYYHNPC